MPTFTSIKNYKDCALALRAAHLNGAILLLSGSQPSTTKTGHSTSVLIGIATKDGGSWTGGNSANGVSWDATPVVIGDNVRLIKPVSENWQYTCLAAGTIGWARYVGNPVDNGLDDPTGLLARIDCSVSLATGTGQLIVSKLTFAQEDVGVATGQITSFNYTLSNALQPAVPL